MNAEGRSGNGPLLETFPIVIDVPIAWGEMDAFGHVNNAVYFRYFESARIAYLYAIGFTGREDGGKPKGVGPILHSTHCRFRLPLAFPDDVRVGARATAVAADRFTMEYRIVSRRLDAVAADGGGIVVAYDYASGSKADLPAAVLDRIEALRLRAF
jgi:acyl-CoA thioester hydrolase